MAKTTSKGDATHKQEDAKVLCVIRIRGAPGMRRKILYTLKLLNLHKQNHCVIVPNTPSVRGMLQTAKDYIAFGEISKDNIKKLLEKRGRLVGNKPITDDHVRFCTVYKSVSELADAIYEGKISVKEVKDLKPVFRLHPPRGGFPGSIKKAFAAGGALGNIGSYINRYLEKMI